MQIIDLLKRNATSLLFFLMPFVLIVLFFYANHCIAQSCWIDLDTTTAEYSVPSLPRPAYLVPMTDPTFGTTVTRVTGDYDDPIVTDQGVIIGTWGNVARHHYSKDQVWNADETLIHVTRNYNGSPSQIFLDGETYEPKFARTVPGDHRWHPTNPDLKIYVSGNQIGYYNVQTGSKQVLHTFSEYSRLTIGEYEGNLSHDGTKIVLYANNSQVFAYDLITDTKYPTRTVSSMDWASVTPLGNYVVIHYSITNTSVYDLYQNLITTFDNVTNGNHTHFDIGLNLLGQQVTGGNCKNKYPGRVVSYRLNDGAFNILNTGGWAVHGSMRCLDRPGWVYSSTATTSSYPPYNDEVISSRTDGGIVERWCHMHNIETDYYAEAMPVPSRDGRRVVFASNWGGSGGRPVYMYVVDARTPCSSASAVPTNPTELRVEK